MDIAAQKKAFRTGTKRGDFKEYISEPFSPANTGMLKAAVSQGYSDAKRTFNNISKFWDKNKTRDDFFAYAAGIIREIFEGPRQDFDDWHGTACRRLCQWFGDDFKISYGQAQKILNMAFKYLYCLDGSEEYNAVFHCCHMPLDSFTLEWYKRCVYQKDTGMQRITDQMKWSNLTQEQYLNIIAQIRKHLKSQPLFYFKCRGITLPEHQLDAELFIWPEMQMHLSAESFYFAFEELDIPAKRKYKDKPVHEKLADIQRCIRDYLPQ